MDTVKTLRAPEAWVTSADMGYGHQRAAYPLAGLAPDGRVLTGGRDDGSTGFERLLWRYTRLMYESVSRMQDIPLLGKPVFRLLDNVLRIRSLYPKRRQHAPTWQVRMLSFLIRRGLGSGLVRTMDGSGLPVVSSFFAGALAADFHRYRPVYCIVTDTDLNRAWVQARAAAGRIEYCAPCKTAVQRLRAYGVPGKRIHLTGFPLPERLLGGPDLPVLKKTLAGRLQLLDPDGLFRSRYHPSVDHFLHIPDEPHLPPARPLTLLFSVGGAGAQQDIGRHIARSLRHRIRAGEIRLILSAGIRDDVRTYFERTARDLFPGNGAACKIIHAPGKTAYFEKFTDALARTDVLWTKPSELVFYGALGIPLILAPPIGSQERRNARWVYEHHAGFRQHDPRYAAHWLFDLLHDGRLAEAAWAGFTKVRKTGTYAIRELIETGRMTARKPPLN